jgi:hypothetical protein
MKHDVLLIGTYHKTGSVWMERVFRNLAEKMGVRYEGPAIDPESSTLKPGFYQDYHSQFPLDVLAQSYRGFRMIRDPRDVIISGAHYHARGLEPWLEVPQKHLQGKSYMEAICELETDQERYLFEMQRVGRHTCKKMLEGCDTLSNLITVKYETWVSDEKMTDFTATLKTLGFDENELALAQKAFFKFSLFGERKSLDGHTRSGKAAQWREKFTQSMGEKFIALYGDALITLGYETSHDWITDLPKR